MNYILLLFIFCVLIFPSVAQEVPIDTIHDIESESVLAVRKSAEDFSNALHKFGEPSIVSALFMDYTWNTDPDKQKKPFLINITAQPILSISGKRWHTGKLLHGLQVIPHITIRVLRNDSSTNDHSLPVRTPSFISRVSYFLSHQKMWNEKNKFNHYIGFGGFHNSNGQDGYEFVYPDSSVNTYNGNFSESLVFEFSYGGYHKISNPVFNSGKTKGRRIQVKEKQTKLYWRTTYEYHPRFATTPRFLPYHMIGRKKLNLQFGYLYAPVMRELFKRKSDDCWVAESNEFKSREVRRFVLNIGYIGDFNYNTGPASNLRQVGPFELCKRLNIDLTWYERIGVTNDYSFFVRAGYYGSDPYNIYFQESIYVFRFGVAYGVFAFGERK